MNPLTVVAIIAGIGYILARRVAGQQVELKSLLILPAVLTVIGLTDLKHMHAVNATTVGFAAFGILTSVALGVARGFTVHLGQRSGALWMRYRASTVVLWVASLGLKAAAIPVEHAVSPTSGAADTFMLTMGLGILAESAVVVLRSIGSEGLVAWEKGKKGGPAKRSAAFDNAQKRMASGSGFRVGPRDW